MKKTVTLLLMLCLLCALLAGCGGEGATETEAPVEETPAETPVPEEELDALETASFDYDNAYAAYSPETVVLNIGETPVNWTKYEGALSQLVYELNAYYGISDLSEELEEGLSVADWALSWTENYLSQLTLLHQKASEQGLTLTEEDRAQIDADIQEQADAYFDGDVDALFAEMHVPEELYRYQAEAALYYDKLFVQAFGEAGELLSEEDAVAYVADQGYLNAKHILWLFTDDEGAELSDEEKDARRAEAAQVLETLQEAQEEQREELFDSLMAQYSQDPGKESYPDGYYFQSGDMVQPFEDAAASLAAGEFSELVESDYGVHLLYRPAMRADHIFDYDSAGQPYTLRYLAADGLFANMMDDWMAELEVAYAEGFEQLDLAGLFAETIVNNETDIPVGPASVSPTMGEKNALAAANKYLQVKPFSRNGLIEQLEYENYTHDEAVYGVDNCGADWYEQAALCATWYLNSGPFSKQGLIDQLEYEGFTHNQAVYGVEKNGY